MNSKWTDEKAKFFLSQFLCLKPFSLLVMHFILKTKVKLLKDHS